MTRVNLSEIAAVLDPKGIAPESTSPELLGYFRENVGDIDETVRIYAFLLQKMRRLRKILV